MNKKTVDIGNRFGQLTVVKLHNEHPRGKSWLCKCECGKEIVIHNSKLIRDARSCGCQQNIYKGLTNRYNRIYRIWKLMQKRCYDPKDISYKNYGEKGIKVEVVWLNSFENFLNWSLENGYESKLSIDRIDNEKDYGPNNCRWTDNYTQSQNRGFLKNNRSGVNGVSFYKGKYVAGITRKGVIKRLGTYSTLEEAAKVRREAEKHYEKYGTVENL